MEHLNWAENWCNINNGTLHYYRTGQSQKPCLILLHGLMDNGLCWTRVARELESRFDIIMPDARGHGKSKINSLDFQMETMAEDIVQLSHSLHLSRVILMGHSMGGQVATIFAGKYPDLVSHLILEDPAFHEQSQSKLRGFLFRQLFLFLVRLTQHQSMEQTKHFCQRMNPKWTKDDIDPWVIAEHEFVENVPKRVIQNITMNADWETLFPNIQAHTLLLISSRGILRPKSARKIIQKVKNARLIQIRDAGHNIRRENYKAFIDAVNSLI